MNKFTKRLLLVLSIIAFISLLVVMLILPSKFHVNSEDTVGNTSSNLYNGGTFCQYGDKVYFANSNDHDFLYVMNLDETNCKKITASSVISINCDEERLYYSLSGKSSGSGLGYVRKSAGLYSCNHKGHDTICYTQNPVAVAVLCGNKLFYDNYEKNSGTTLYSIAISKKDNHRVINGLVNPSCINNSRIYYQGVNNDHYLYVLDPLTEAYELFLEKDVYMPILYGSEYIFYIDPTNNYALCRYDRTTEEDLILTDERVDFYNIYGDIIYYQVSVGEAPALHRINSDGTNDIILSSGVYKDIQTTSEYVYFRAFDDDSVTYHCSHYGSPVVSQFLPK